MRRRSTHTLTVYQSTETAETDSLGDPIDGWAERFSVEVEAYPPSTQSSGGATRTNAGTVTEADMVALARDQAAADIEVGSDHAVLAPVGTSEAEAYVVEHSRALTGRYATPDVWEVHLALEAAGDPSDYP